MWLNKRKEISPEKMYNFIVLLSPITLDTAGAKSNNPIKLLIMWKGIISCENMNVNI
jgi:hypothetical protein